MGDGPLTDKLADRRAVAELGAELRALADLITRTDVPLVEADARFARLCDDQARRMFGRLASPDAANPDVAHG